MESNNEYTLVDEEGNHTKVVFVHRICGCNSLGCVDDEIQIYDEEIPYRLQVPRVMTPFIEGVFRENYKVTPQGYIRISQKDKDRLLNGKWGDDN